MKKIILGIGVLSLLAGCSATPFDSADSGIMEGYEEMKKAEAQTQAGVPISNTVVNIDRGVETSVPSWFLVPPQDDEDRIYAVGTGLSNDMQFSFDKAMHFAKTVLGDKMLNSASSSVQSYIEDSSKGALGATTTNTVKVSKSGYTGADVSKYKIEKTGVFKDRRDFRTYVLLSLNPQNRDHGSEEVVNTFSDADKAKAQAAMDNL